jgi:hypothetical protein
MAPRRLAAHPVVSVLGNGPRCHPHEHYTSRRFPGMTHQQLQNTKDRTSGETLPINRWICQKEIVADISQFRISFARCPVFPFLAEIAARSPATGETAQRRDLAALLSRHHEGSHRKEQRAGNQP